LYVPDAGATTLKLPLGVFAGGIGAAIERQTKRANKRTKNDAFIFDGILIELREFLLRLFVFAIKSSSLERSEEHPPKDWQYL